MTISSHPTTLLLVEDNPHDVVLFRRALSKLQLAFALQVVGDGDAAVRYLGGEAGYADRQTYPLPVAILLDLKLPRRDGFEVLQWIRRQPGIRRLPVVVFTSSQTSFDIDRAYDLGASSYLVKPIGLPALQDLVRTLVSYWLGLNAPPSVV
ncbi:MAG: response regulator [Roseiflexaceae bacterium]